MTTPKYVLIVGLQPRLIDFSGPEFAAFPGLNADKVMAGLNAAATSLAALGHEATLCLTDFGETAETVLAAERTEEQEIRLRRGWRGGQDGPYTFPSL